MPFGSCRMLLFVHRQGRTARVVARLSSFLAAGVAWGFGSGTYGQGPVRPEQNPPVASVPDRGLTERSEPQTYPLWPDGPPGAATTPADKAVPTLTVFQPPKNVPRSGALVIVCPGGGYGMLAPHEAEPIAEWLNSLGITAAILRYRHGSNNPHPNPLSDASRAIRLARANGAQWQIDPNRVAILGFSAGGHLASSAGTHFDAGKPDAADTVEHASSRPDRMILIYPVISMREPLVHGGSKRNLLGANPDPALVASLSNESQVTPETPPTFLVHTADDSVVGASNSLEFALSCQRARVPVELHLFEKGPHGFGLGLKEGRAEAPFGEWTHLCARWLEGQGFTKKPSVTRRSAQRED